MSAAKLTLNRRVSVGVLLFSMAASLGVLTARQPHSTTLPFVSFDSSGSVVTANFSSPAGFDTSDVHLYIDGQDVSRLSACTDHSLAFSLGDASTAANSHSIRVEVTDRAGNHAMAAEGPNVFVDKTTVSYDLPQPSHIRARICPMGTDTAIRTLDLDQGAGENSIDWDGMDDQGQPSQPIWYVVKVERQSATGWVPVIEAI